MSAIDPYALPAATFLISTLELDLDPADLALDVYPLTRERNAAVSAVQLDSSAGPAAFIVYQFHMFRTDEFGRLGSEAFDEDLAILQRAAEMGTPGPRVIAHSAGGKDGFILATTPQTFRGMVGAAGAPHAGTDVEMMPAEASLALRAEAADRLLVLLRDANTAAKQLLEGLQVEALRLLDTGLVDALEMSPEEQALELFVLDQESIGNLLHLFAVIVDSAAVMEPPPRPERRGKSRKRGRR